MRRLILTIPILCFVLSASAQDIHFSQFFASPTYTNPALTGHFDATYRVHAITRNQWWAVSDQPFQTFGAAVDVNAPFNIKRTGAGLQISHDVAGLSALTTTQIYGLLSYRIPILPDRNMSLHLGVSGGMYNQSIDFTRLTFDRQFIDNQFNPGAGTGELSGVNSVSTLNFSSGAYFEQRFSERLRWGAGFSAANLTEPDRGYFKQIESRLVRRNDVHFLSSFPLGGMWDIMPSGRYQWQGTQREIIGGAAFRYHLSTGEMNSRSVQLGTFYRFDDAIYATMGIQLNDLYVGGSYDINISRLQPATNSRGGWEVTVIYLIPTVRDKVKRLRQCPDYI